VSIADKIDFRIIEQKKRRCSRSGKRTEGAVYLVTELSPDGSLPPTVEIVPARPFTGEFFRGIIQVSLDDILDWEPYKSYIRGTTKDRRARETIHEQETTAFGMSIQRRVAFGICAGIGIPALQEVYPPNHERLGYCLRDLSRHIQDKTSAKALNAFAKHEWALILAALWKGWFSYTPEKKEKARGYFASIMIALNAAEDAAALYT